MGPGPQLVYPLSPRIVPEHPETQETAVQTDCHLSQSCPSEPIQMAAPVHCAQSLLVWSTQVTELWVVGWLPAPQLVLSMFVL